MQSTLTKRWVSLLIAVTVVAVVWLGVLPRLGTQPVIRNLIDRNEELGIDPSAKFYTEHPATGTFLDRIKTAHRRSGESFWSRSPSPVDDKGNSEAGI